MIEAELVPLDLLPDGPLPEREVGAEEHLPFVIEPFARRKRAVGRAITIRPIIVPGSEYRGRFECVEVPERLNVSRTFSDD